MGNAHTEIPTSTYLSRAADRYPIAGRQDTTFSVVYRCRGPHGDTPSALLGIYLNIVRI